MSGISGPKIITSGCVLSLDAADKLSYKGSGTTWTDLSGNNNTGTLTNGPSFSGANSGCIVFDGTDDYILDSSVTSFNVGCIDMWIRPSLLINASAAFSNLLQLKIGATDAEAWNIAFGISTGALTNEYITIADGSISPTRRTGLADGGSLSANTWYNIVFNWESTVYKIYINNVLKTTIAAAGGDVAQLTLPNRYVIGAFQVNNTAVYNGFFVGSISTTKLYNRTLSTVEMLQNYNAVKSRFGL